MFKTIANAFKVKDLRKKILLTLLLLFVYRLGCWIPAPGFDIDALKESASGSSLSIFTIMNMISGGALANCSILALGVSPYITASIVIQLLTVAIPSLERLSKAGEDGRKKISLYTRIAALVLAIAQAIGIVVSYSGAIDTANALWSGAPLWLICAGIVLILVAGAMFTVWLGEKITSLGVGNGMSLLIFIGIISTGANGLLEAFKQVFSGNLNGLWTILIFIAVMILIFALIVFVDCAERRVPVQYAKQIKGRKMYGGQSTYIPVKVNGSGVMPIIFASALISFPQLIISMFWPGSSAEVWYQNYMGTNSWAYIVILALLIFVFTFFYAQIMFNPDDVSKRIQQQGGFIPGIRPGKPTAEHLKRISRRVTLFGAFYLAFIALIPSLAFKAVGDYALSSVLISSFSATGLMILVSVALELDKQLEAQMLMRNYKGFLN